MRKLQYITVLRAIAILSVLIIHVSKTGSAVKFLPGLLLSMINDAGRGVQLFYLLSAFTLYLSFSFKNKTDKFPKTSFYIARFFRIAPLFYIAIVYYIWQNGLGPNYWAGAEGRITTGNIIANFLFIHGFNPYWINSLVPGGWSIAVEVFFYAIFPFIFYRVRNIQQASNFVLISLAIRAILLLVLMHHPLVLDIGSWSNYLFMYFPNQLPLFALGVLLYFIICDNNNFNISPKTLLFYFSLSVIELATQREWVIPIIFMFGISFIILALALQKYQPKILFNNVIIYIGNISYTIYLSHFAAIHLVEKLNIFDFFNNKNMFFALGNFMINYSIILAISVALSTVLYYSIEQPMIGFGKNLIKKINL